MKKTKKNNKGFSLVELIVVVLIMAIIAVALAPQVMKWVNHSRTSTDVTAYDTLVENAQLALNDEDAWAEVKNQTADITFTIGATATTVSNAGSAYAAKIDEICGTGWKTKTIRKDAAAADYVITVTHGTGELVKTTPPDGTSVK